MDQLGRQMAVAHVLRETQAHPGIRFLRWPRAVLGGVAGALIIALAAGAVYVGAPGPSTQPLVLDAPGVAASLDNARTFDVSHTVVARVTIDASAVPALLLPTCLEPDCNSIVGVLVGGGSLDIGISASPTIPFANFLDANQTFTGTVALDIEPTGVILLGVVETPPDGAMVRSVRQAATAFVSGAPAGTAVLVRGYLGSTLFRCFAQPSPASSPVQIDPSSCETFLADSPFAADTNSLPDGRITVQGGAAFFAPANRSANGQETPSAVYVLRPPTRGDPGPAGCVFCLGWRVVALVDNTTDPPLPALPSRQPQSTSGLSASPPDASAPSMTPDPQTTSGHVLSAAELLTEIGRVRSNDGTPEDVVANVSVDRDRPIIVSLCTPGGTCPERLGIIHEIGDAVVFAAPDDPYPDETRADSSSPIALRLFQDGALQFLGHVEPVGDPGLAWSIAGAYAHMGAVPLGHVLAVEGWLSTLAGRNGPSLPPGRLPPFNFVWADVLSPTATEPEAVTGWTSSQSAIRIQQRAYESFAPGVRAPGASPPAFGTYLIEHVAQQTPDCSGCDGWLMVGRVASPPQHLGVLMPLAPDAALIQNPNGLELGTLADVPGWLVDSGGPIPCPAYPSPVTPPTSPCDPACNRAWITAVETQPVTGSFGSWSDPSRSVRVQEGAYQQFAHDPAYEANGFAHVPRLGTYTLRLVQDMRFPVDGARGWEIVARLEP